MKKTVLFLPGVMLACNLMAQQVNWAFNIPQPGATSALVADNNSDVYQYGYYSNVISYSGPMEGSWIRKYSGSGAKLFQIHWPGKIFITRMIHDGNDVFYFTGFFSDTVTVDGIHLTPHGKDDCFFGMMDEQGHVSWLVGFGGAGNDRAMSLTFNQDSTAVVLTGGVDSTIYLNSVALFTTTKAIFLGSFNLNGGLMNHKTYSFLPTQYGNNVGLEIGTNTSGYYLLADRMGEHWSHEPFPPGTEMEGRYLFKLDNNFNITWSRFIISSSCYYGYTCKNMAVCHDDAYVPRFCSGKYGGSGHLARLNFPDGNEGWTLDNHDGQYYDCKALDGRVFFIGNEEVNGCPCEDNDPGNAKLKVVDKSNIESVLIAKHGFQFYNVCPAKNGNIYVCSYTHGDNPSFEGFTLSDGPFLFSIKDTSTGVRETESSSPILTLFPNPSQGNLKVESQGAIDELTVFDLNGAAVYHTQPNTKSCSVDGLSSGCYALQVKSGDKYTTSKIVVVK